MKETADSMTKNKADLDKLKEEVTNEEYIEDKGADDLAEDVVKDTLKKRLPGPVGYVLEVMEEGGKYYFKWRTVKALEEYSAAQVTQAKDALETSIISRKTANTERQNLTRLKEIEKEEKRISGQLATERTKLQRMTGPELPGSKELELKRELDLPGDKREKSKNEAWRGIKKSNQISFGGGYMEADMPQQVIGRIVSGGLDFPLILTPDTLEGFYGEAAIEVPLDWDAWTGHDYDTNYFSIQIRGSDVDGDDSRIVDTPAGATSGFVWIDPLDPGVPFPVGLGGGGLSWDARVSSSVQSFQASVMFQETNEWFRVPQTATGSYIAFSSGLGATVISVTNEIDTSLENLTFAGFNVRENYEFSTTGFGPRFELNVDIVPGVNEVLGGDRLRIRASGFAAATYDLREFDVRQNVTGPFFGGFDHTQRVKFDDDGFNLRYGVRGSVGLEFEDGVSVAVVAGWQGETDAPTIRPADGSFAPGAPIGPATADASAWFVGVELRASLF